MASMVLTPIGTGAQVHAKLVELAPHAVARLP
jgi:hypothetical protein